MRFTIPLPPITKKNHQQIRRNFKTGKPFISQSEQYRQYERDAGYFIPKGRTIKTAVNVKCLFYMPTSRKVDLTNLLEATDDILVRYGLIEDDNYTVIQSHDGSRVFIDRENPRTEIEITEVQK